MDASSRVLDPRIRISRVESSHLEDFRALRLAALKGSPTDFWQRYEDALALDPAWWEEFALGEIAWFLAYVDDQPAGMAGYKPTAWGEQVLARDVANVTGVFVHPEFRGRGISRTLMDRVARHGLTEDRSILHLHVASTNEVASIAYENMGFVATGHRVQREPADLGEWVEYSRSAPRL